MEMIWNWKFQRTVVARGRRRRVKEKMRRKREEVTARKVVVRRFILIYFNVVPVYVLIMVIKTTHSYPNLSLIPSGSAGGKPLPRRRTAL